MLNNITSKIYVMIITTIACMVISYNVNSYVFAQDSNDNVKTEQITSPSETKVETSTETPSSETSTKIVEEKTQDNQDKPEVKEPEKKAETIDNKQPESLKEKTVTKEEPTKEQQPQPKPSLVQTPEEAKLPQKDINQLVADNIAIHLDLGIVTNIKVSSDSLLKSELSGFSLFIKLTSFPSDLSLLLTSRYSALIAESGSNQTDFNAKIERIAIGSSIKYKLNKHFSATAGLDLGLSYGNKYMFDGNKVSFTKILIGVITTIDYSFSFNPNFHLGFKFNLDLGPASGLESLVYVGLSF